MTALQYTSWADATDEADTLIVSGQDFELSSSESIEECINQSSQEFESVTKSVEEVEIINQSFKEFEKKAKEGIHRSSQGFESVTKNVEEGEIINLSFNEFEKIAEEGINQSSKTFNSVAKSVEGDEIINLSLKEFEKKVEEGKFRDKINKLETDMGWIQPNSTIQAKKMVIGVITMYFPNKSYKPLEYTIATMTHYVQGKCTKGWETFLESQVNDLDVTHLYIAGERQKRIVSNFLKNVYLFNQPLSPRPSRCLRCNRFGCSLFKANKMLSELYKTQFHFECE